MNWDVIMTTVVTVVAIFAIIAVIYYFSTAKRIKKQHQRYQDLLNSLKPGIDVVFVGGLVGTIESIDSTRTFATIKVGNTKLKTTLYSIGSIIEK